MPYKPAHSLLAELDILKDRNPVPAAVLDLASGSGDNGLKLLDRGFEVTFADRLDSALKVVRQQVTKSGLPGHVWQVDLEKEGINPFQGRSFDVIICFRYLHRPLFPALLEAVCPGGMVVYETFTSENSQFGRPNNPDFLLRPGELKTVFRLWEIIHYYEGVQQNPGRAIAQLVARKPAMTATAEA